MAAKTIKHRLLQNNAIRYNSFHVYRMRAPCRPKKHSCELNGAAYRSVSGVGDGFSAGGDGLQGWRSAVFTILSLFKQSLF